MAGTYKGLWYPITPAGCKRNTLPDMGADEYYAAGCEPLIYTWLSPDKTRRLNRYGTITRL